MRKKKNVEDKRVRITVSMPKEMRDIIEDNTSNKSRYIERALLEYFNMCGLDTSKIKL